ncbi:AAA family ATPase [Actinoplanes sp. NPDC051633]|uniref:helix-turn-helix transcriptional regulator n=1 Tax=Actinoplanes sp. NPDC051633 TaxID=3155670 RepID=UPI0034164D66
MPRVLLQREREIAALGRQIGAVRAGAGRLIVVEGPAGIGKSSLLTATARMARAASVRVLRAWGGPLERDAGWQIARQLFAPVRAGSEWNRLAVGVAALALPALDPESAAPALVGDAMHAATHGLIALTCDLAERSPTLLIIDDAHWADLPSLRWLVRTTHQIADLPLGIVCTIRSGETAAQSAVLSELLAAAPEAPIRPQPLDAAAVQRFVHERLPRAGPAFVEATHTATAGNPFLLGALTDHLIAGQIEPVDEIAGSLNAFGPEQIARSVERQLARLPAGAEALAKAFAVLGSRAPLRHARDVAGLGSAEATRVADHLRAAGLLDGSGVACGLTQPLVTSAVYGGLPAGERSLWHARVAALLQRERTDPEAVASHLLHCEPAAEPATVAVLRAAADRAGLRGAPESASAFLRRALAEPPLDRAVEAEVRSELGLSLAAYVQPAAFAHLDDAVELASTPVQRSRIALSGGRALGLAGQSDEAIRLCRRGLAHPSGVAPGLLARLEAELVANTWLHAPTAAEARERLHRRLADPDPLPLWLVHRAWEAICDARPKNEPRSLLASALAGGAFTDDADSMLETFATLTLIACGDLDVARERCSALVDVARTRGRLTALAHGSVLRAIALVAAGRISDAEADARFAVDFKLTNSSPPATLWALFPLVDALVELDELADADAALAAASRLGELPPDGLSTAMLLERRARLRLAQHRPADAHDDCLAAAGGWERLGIKHPGVANWRVDDCTALVALGDIGGARKVAEEHVELADHVGLPGPLGAGLRALAQTTDRSAAINLLRQSVDLLADSQAQLEHTRSLLALGAALRRANHRAAAKVPLRKVLDLADRGGMLLLARHARRELQAVGARPRRTAVSGLDALTAAEHRVAELAAGGWSNRQISEQLYVTRRTVETHLTHVFRKLHLAARIELATCFTKAQGG